MKITHLLSDKPYSGAAIAACFAILLLLPWLHLLPVIRHCICRLIGSP